MKSKILADFQICISVPLSKAENQFSDGLSSALNEFFNSIKYC